MNYEAGRDRERMFQLCSEESLHLVRRADGGGMEKECFFRDAFRDSETWVQFSEGRTNSATR